MMSPQVHENPETFDPYRFLRWRSEAGKENLAHLVSTSSVHLAFGHGNHGCPGRFFAANEIKVIMCHLLLKYEWKLVEGTPHSTFISAFSMNANPFTKVLFRRRERVEVSIDEI